MDDEHGRSVAQNSTKFDADHVDALGDWCCVDDVRPKPEKCKIMQISFLQKVPPQLNIVIDTIPLQRDKSFTLLGVIIQSDLKWNSQVQQMVSRAAR